MNLIGYGLNSHLLAGNRDNTGDFDDAFYLRLCSKTFFGSLEIGQFIAEQLGLDLPAVTERLNDKNNEEWLVNEVGRDKVEV